MCHHTPTTLSILQCTGATPFKAALTDEYSKSLGKRKNKQTNKQKRLNQVLEQPLA